MKLIFLFFLLFLQGSGKLISPPENTLAEIRGERLDIDVIGRLAVLDEAQSTLHLYSSDGTPLRSIGGQGWDNDQFDSPRGLWAGNGVDIFVADYGNHRIQRFDRSLNFVSSLSSRESNDPAQRFGYPTDVALSRLGDLFICDSENSRVLKVNRLTKVELSFGGFDAGKGRLRRPTRIAIGPGDRVYVLDDSRIAVFDNFGNYLHDLPIGTLKSPVALDADESYVAITDNRLLSLFTHDDIFITTISLEKNAAPPANIHDIALKGMQALVLTDSGITAIDFPQLDK